MALTNQVIAQRLEGVKLKEIMPILKIIATQNSLKLNSMRQFKIACRIMVQSTLDN